jgi:enamine deaminase RidA (YjgF/YER057c/UK114 family)
MELEDRYGYQRAVRSGDRVLVSGTAPVWPDGRVELDPAAQARRCCEIIVEALEAHGATANDVVRTRIFITNVVVADAVGEVHREVFGEAKPVTSMVVVQDLLDPVWVVEIEAEAIKASK